MASEKKSSRSGDEWDRRLLCSDESCIGVIGPDGRCKECGLEYQGELPWQAEEGETAGGADREDAISPPVSADVAGGVEDDDEAAEAASDDEWDRRVLCSDESCIGVIGPDGRCKECGKPYREE
jgi:hypothetical protein